MTSEVLSKVNGAGYDFKSKAQGQIHGAENQLEDIARNAGKKVGALASNFATSATDYVKTGREYVTENPIKGAAIAAGVGVVVGSLLTMSMRRSSK